MLQSTTAKRKCCALNCRFAIVVYRRTTDGLQANIYGALCGLHNAPEKLYDLLFLVVIKNGKY